MAALGLGGKDPKANTLSGIKLLMMITLPSNPPSMEVGRHLCSTTPRQSLLSLPLTMSNWTSQPREEHPGEKSDRCNSNTVRLPKVPAGLRRVFLEIREIGKRAA